MNRSNRPVIIDTNVLISFLLKAESIPGQTVRHVLIHDTPLLSEDTEKELFRKLLNPKFDRYVTLDLRMAFFDTFVRRAEKISPSVTVHDCRDSEDNKFLELARSGNARYIISGDKDLLVFDPYQGIRIVTPKDFLMDQKQEEGHFRLPETS